MEGKGYGCRGFNGEQLLQFVLNVNQDSLIYLDSLVISSF